MRAAIVLGTLACACYSPTPPEGAPCNAALECPSPLRCYGGRCTSAPADDGGIDAPPQDTNLDGPLACATPPALPAFATPALVTALSTTFFDDGTPTLTADRLELYFKSTRTGGSGGMDLWKSTRAQVSDSWGTPTQVTELDTIASEEAPDVSPDGLTLYFTSDRPGGAGRRDFYVSTRASRSAAWSPPSRIVELSSVADDEGIHVSPSGLVAYFHSDRDATPFLHALYRATRTSLQSAWSTPVRVDELYSGTGDENPWVSADDCTMYYQTARAGGAGSGDIWLVRRATPTSPFANPVALGALNTGAYDADPWISADERYIIYVSDRGGTFDIYESSR